MKRLAKLVAAAVAGALIPVAVINAPVQAASGACPTESGVTVIVDATAVGGSVSQRCAPDRPSSGLDALRKAGFSWTPVSSQPAMVCRIDGRPGPADQTCVSSPPSTAYWGYFRANRGGEWKYSSIGASAAPIAGGVEGWVFLTGTQRPPSIKPPAAIERTQAIAPTASASAKPSKSATASSSRPKASATPTASGTAVAAGSPAPAAQPAVPTGAAAEPAATAPPTPVDDIQSAVAADAVVAPTGGGSAVSTLIGVVVLAALVLGAVALGARRRRSS